MFIMNSFKVNINPEIIKWSMETVNMPEDVIIKKLGINKNKFGKWINKEDKPTYVQLQKFAKIVNVSPLIFLSDKIPDDRPMNVFRTYNNTKEKSYKTLLKIKRIKFLQDITVELYNNLNISKEAYIEQYDINSDPGEIAVNERKKFYDFDYQMNLKDKYDALNKFRAKVEDNNIIVMQFPFDDIRGFSLIDKKPFFIALNSKDDPASRIFTLFHEYAHILLRKNESNHEDNYNIDDKIEEWCNNFASYFLISDEIIKNFYNKHDSTDSFVKSISYKYKLSYSMIFYRLYKLGYIENYEDEYNKFIKDKKIDKKTLGGNYIRNIRSEYGNKFINIVNENYEKNEITLNDALRYLSVKINTFYKLMEMVNQ